MADADGCFGAGDTTSGADTADLRITDRTAGWNGIRGAAGEPDQLSQHKAIAEPVRLYGGSALVVNPAP